MARKNTTKANLIKPPKSRIFEIGVRKGEEIMIFIIEATRIDNDVDSLIIYDYIGNNEEKVGYFNEWVYFFTRTAMSQEEKEMKLPATWGEVNGKKF